MKRHFSRSVSGLFFSVILLSSLISCGKDAKKEGENEISDLQQVSFVKKSHKWYYFTKDGFTETELPQQSPQVMELPWTEAVRISSAASVPSSASEQYQAYALVNHLGLIAFSSDKTELFTEVGLFDSRTADSLVFSGKKPVFYLYKSYFFNKGSDEEQDRSHRPFLMDLNPRTGVFYPLVSYENLGLQDDEDIVGFSWNGQVWTCAAKKIDASQIEWKYFTWQPLVELTEFSPALTSDMYIFKNATEDDFKAINMPLLFSSAPAELRSLVASIPAEFSFYVSWRDGSGTSPKSYYQAGNNASTVNAKGISDATSSGLDVIVFADGTTYLRDTKADSICAFRLPLLPAGYSYGEVAIAGNQLIVAWEENNFYKTKRSGFIEVDMDEVRSKI